MNDQPYSKYWCHLGEFTKGPQPCGCGKPSDCANYEKHVARAIKSLKDLPVVNPVPYSVQDFREFWQRGGLVR